MVKKTSKKSVQKKVDKLPRAAKAIERGKIPGILKTIAIVHYILAGIYLLLAVVSIVMPDLIIGFAPDVESLGALGIGVFVVTFLAFGILYIFIARGLWRIKNWARITAVILALFNIISAIISINTETIQSIISVIIYVAIAGYLLFDKRMKVMFSKKA